MDVDVLIEAPYAGRDIDPSQLDHAVWSEAAPVLITQYWSGEPAPAGRHAEARVVWSDAALGVRFVCPQSEQLVVSPRPETKSKTLGLWDRDVCEIYIAPDPTV